MQTRKRKSLESEDATKPPETEHQSKKRKNTPAEAADAEAKAEKERGKTRDHSKTKSSAPPQSEAVNKQTDKQVQAPPRPAPRARSALPPTSYPAQPPPAVPSSAAEMASGNNGEDPFSSHSTLHGLLRKLGAGFEDLVPGMMGGGSSQIKAIMTGLKQVDDEGQQLVSLTELCDVLSVAGEESMGSFPFETLVPLLVQLLNMEHNPDIMLLAARALTFMADSMPSTCSVISRHGAVPALCGRLLTIEYIDLAEQSLQALEKISHDYPHVLLQHGGLLAVLSYLDFFPTSVQRVAAKTAANICRGISTSHSEAVLAAVPILTSLLQYQDSKVVDSACLALSYIVTAFAGQPTLMSQLTSEDLLTRTLQLLSISDTGSMNSQITTGTYFSLIKLLSTFINGCPAKAARILLLANDPEGGAIEIVRKLLSTSSMLSSFAATSSSVVRSSDQLQAVVQLAADTLPAAPDAPSAVLSGHPLTSTPTATPSEHEKVLKETPHLLDKFSSQIMPFLLQVYSTSAMSQVRQTCLVAISRILFASSPAMLQEGLKEIPISSFIGGLISSKDSNTAAYAMQLAEILMLKLPSIFSPYFLKEGVVHAIDQLAAKATKANPPSAPAAATEKTSIRSSIRITKKATEKETSPPKPAPAPTPPTMKEALAARASQFQSLYFASGSSGGETQGLILLRSLSEGLPTQADSKGLSRLLSALGGSETSVFELLSSGAMHHLLSFLTGQDLMGGEGNGDQVLLRLERLMEAAGDMTAHSSSHPGHSAPQAVMTAVVRKLQAALSSLESFPIAFTSQRAPAQDAGGSRGLPPGLSGLMSGRYGRGGGGGGGGSGSGLALLAQPFKLRLARHPSEKQLRDYGANVVMIEPLASFGAIEDFLYTRVYRTGTSPEKPLEASKAKEGKGGPSDPPAPAPGSGSRRKSKEAARGEDKTAAQPIPDEASRAAGRRVTRSRSAKEKEVPPEDEVDDFDMLDEEGGDKEGEGVPQGDSDDANHFPAGEMEVDEEGEPIVGEEEDEEHYMDEEEDDDGEGGGEEEEIARPMPVHDLHVASEGDLVSAMAAAAAVATEAAAKGSIAQAGFAGPSPAAAPRTTAPVAAPTPPPAAAASEPPASARDAVGQGAKARLVFYLDGRKLTSGTTIFQAVQQQATQSAALRPQEADRDDDEDDEGAQGTAASIGRLWEAVHTIHYRLLSDVEAEEARSEKEAPPSVSPQQPSLRAGGKKLTSPLAELLLDPLAAEGGSSLATLSTSQPCKEVLALLQIFEAVSRLGHRVTLHPSAGSSVTPTKALGDKTSAKEPSVPPSAALALSTAVSREEFVSSKLGSKLGQQLKDVLSICGQTLPLWMSSLVNGPCKFLFPFEARRRYFYSTAFGLSRALNHMQQLNASESTGGAGGARGGQGHIDRDGRVELRIGRLQRQKVRVSRKRVLDSAIKVMELYSKQKTVLEIEYFGEVGTGLGPTLEFYTLLSHDLQQRSLGLWRHEDNVQATASEGERPAAAGSGELWHEASEFVNAPYGLFPQPIPPPGSLASFIPNPNAVVAQRARAAEVFKLLGRTLAKALQDCRLMDLPLSYVFYRVALGKPLDILDISRIDPHLGRSLEKMKEALRSYRDALSSPSYSPERPPVLLVDGLRLCDLCLSFTLPGQPSYELCPGGADVEVEDAEGLEKYIAGIVDATLGSGVAAQLASFREGFNDVFPLETLSCFYEDEIETMLCGSGEKWTVQSLADGIKFDHGYSISNGGGGPVVRSFLEVLSEFDAADQRRFLRFVTGCPRLPPGGIAVLQPKLTVVRKPPSGFEAFPSSGGGAVGSPSMGGSFKDTSGMGTTAADGDLPSVMTCANYIKLPPYSTKEVMRQRLTYAIREGQGSFDLS